MKSAENLDFDFTPVVSLCTLLLYLQGLRAENKENPASIRDRHPNAGSSSWPYEAGAAQDGQACPHSRLASVRRPRAFRRRGG